LWGLNPRPYTNFATIMQSIRATAALKAHNTLSDF
jgi:hypothetical protein